MASSIVFQNRQQNNDVPDPSSPLATSINREHPDGVDVPGRKLKGKQRLIHHLQRISSSPSLPQLGRRRGTRNLYGGRGSKSSASLASASPTFCEHRHSQGNSFSSASSAAGYSTAPTSAPSTPGLDSSSNVERLKAKLREVRKPSTECDSPRTGPVPAASSRPVSRGVLLATHSEVPEIIEDYFARPTPAISTSTKPPKTVDFWGQIPQEIRLAIFSYLKPIELVQASRTSKMFHELCFDGQLWTSFDASSFYNIISADSLSKIVVRAGPFIKNLNLRGCVQVEHHNRTETIVKACSNLTSATLEGCRHLTRSSLECLVLNNTKLKSINLTGLLHVNNKTMKIVAASCPQLEVINVSWCKHMDARGFLPLLNCCTRLTDIRAGEIRGFNNLDVASAIFETNNLERLVLSGCTDLDDDALGYMIHGKEPELDILTDRPIVPVRRLRDLDISRCTRLTSDGIQHLAHFVPYLTGLQLSGCSALTDSALETLVATTPNLTHLDLEELTELTDEFLSNHLAKSACVDKLQHLSLSYCENVGDAGVVPVLKVAMNIRSLEVDNTRISDLVLAEAAQLLKARNIAAFDNPNFGMKTGIKYGLRLICYDCLNVSWTGIREVMSRNSEIPKPIVRRLLSPGLLTSSSSSTTSTASSTSELFSPGLTTPSILEFTQHSPSDPYFPPQEPESPLHPDFTVPPPVPREIMSLKAFYGWQPTVNEHTRRVLSNDIPGARRLERKWADWMVATEELNTASGGGLGWAGGMGIWNAGNGIMGRRRRRRARDAERAHVEEETAGEVGTGTVDAEAQAPVEAQTEAQAGTETQGSAGGIGAGRRRRARGGGCVMM